MSATNKLGDNPKSRSSSKISPSERAEAVDSKTPLMISEKNDSDLSDNKKNVMANTEEIELEGTKSHDNRNEKHEMDDLDGVPRSRRPSVTLSHNNHHHDFEIGSVVLEEIPDINVYQHKKTLAQGMMDLALFSANANQLRYVLDSYTRHPYYYPSLIFIIVSLLIQVAIGVLLIWNATYNVKDEKEVCRANKINNYTVIGIFLVTVINVFISAFGVADPPDIPTAVVTANST